MKRIGVGATAAAVAVAPALMLPSAAFAAGPDPINFPSGQFFDCLVNLGVDTDSDGVITEDEAAAFTGALNCATTTSWGYPSIAGIEYFTGVTSINLSGAGIQDLSPFFGGTNNGGGDSANPDAPASFGSGVRNLDLSNNATAYPLQNIGYLANFVDLENLNLANNASLEDLSVLATLTNLTNLDLSNNVAVDDLSFLPGSLETVRLSGIPAPLNLNVFASNTNLRTLEVNDTGVEDLSPLAGATNLRTLDARNTPDLEDLNGLASTSLEYLDISNSSVVDLTPLAGLTTLETLRVENTAIADVSTLASLTGLLNFSAANANIVDITALENLSLESVNLSGNNVTDASVLADNASLIYLNLADNAGVDISALTGLTNISYLNVARTGVSDIDVLSGYATLTVLDLSENEISDISALEGLNLYALYLNNNHVVDLRPLAGHTNLTALTLFDQTASAADAMATVAFDNPVRNQAGNPIALTVVTGEGTYADGKITWTKDGASTASWSQDVTIGTATASFSGVLSQDVVPFDGETILTGAFEMPWYGYMGMALVALLGAAAFGFVMLRKRATI